MSFSAPPTMVKRLADDRAIAEADLSHLAAVVGRPDAKWREDGGSR
jgi:hypothetical protein